MSTGTGRYNQNEATMKDSTHSVSAQSDEANSANKSNGSFLSSTNQHSGIIFATTRTCGRSTGTIASATATGTSVSDLPASAAMNVASCIPKLTQPLHIHPSVNSSSTHQPLNLFPTPSQMLQQPQLQQPLAVDSALLLQRQLTVGMASNIATLQQSPTYPHLRSGKWLPAEENYALLLVALFERGMIKDCVDGTTTLRTYLSQKLHCAPMRISKKFAGRGIGKLIYTSKAAAASSIEQQKIPELLHRLRIAEQLFLQAAYPTSVAASMGLIPFPLLQVPTTLPPPLPVFPATLCMPGMVANPNVMSIPQMAVPQVVVPMITVSSSPEEVHTSELHKSYLRALEQADDEEPILNLQNNTVSQAVATSIPQTPISNGLQVNAEIPDLLSGFEKVVQGMRVEAPANMYPVAALSSEYSPPFTSRSFDEFHRFLGKDEITLLDTTEEAPTPDITPLKHNSHVTANTMDSESILPTPAIPLHTDALFIAESYAMLAEESPGANFISLPGATSSHSEVEDILQQVQTHRNHHEPPRQSETMSTHSSFYDVFTTNTSQLHRNSITNPPTNVTISHCPSTVGPLSNPSKTGKKISTSLVTTTEPTLNRNRHVTASSQSEDANIVSGSEPSGGSSSSSRSNTSNASSGTDSAGTSSNDDDGSEEDGLTSSGGECDSAEDDDIINNIDTQNGHIQQESPSSSPNPPSRKRMRGISNSNSSGKHQKRGEHGKPKKVQFQ